jgi:hypothetical protein
LTVGASRGRLLLSVCWFFSIAELMLPTFARNFMSQEGAGWGAVGGDASGAGDWMRAVNQCKLSGRTAYIGQFLCGCTPNRVNGFFSFFFLFILLGLYCRTITSI